ncbi:MAG TPA: nucleotidyltransferase domain-containing protein [archaeon]|nr:nucleotidyltransferase domain-containing protein [archaeon]
MGKANPRAVALAKDFKARAAAKYRIRRIILFGSQATGRWRPDSDIDLLVVADRPGSKPAFMSDLLREWHVVQEKSAPVDFVCVTPREFKIRAKRVTLVQQALERGVAV